MRFLWLFVVLAMPFTFMQPRHTQAQEKSWILHTYEVKFRLKGQVTTTQVQAADAGKAKQLVEAQFGPGVTVLGTKKLK
jgi:hypothetical protein